MYNVYMNSLYDIVDYISSGYRKERTFIQKPEITIKNTEGFKTSDITSSTLTIAIQITECKNCQLAETRKKTVPGEGAENPLVLVVGEGPGEDEDIEGRPFVGKAGQLLDKMLASINLSRNTNCYIANIVKCRPPNNREPHSEETAACFHFLEKQISVLKPKIILAAGRIAGQNLLKTPDTIVKMRGKFHNFSCRNISGGNLTIPLLVTYHPAAVLRNSDLRAPVWEDLKLLRSKLEL